jgi:hypothetical protein
VGDARLPKCNGKQLASFGQPQAHRMKLAQSLQDPTAEPRILIIILAVVIASYFGGPMLIASAI